jgi:carboxypeptidase Taq
MDAQTAYEELLRRAREDALLESCQAILGWDELTYMPPGAVQGRADQFAYLAGLQHDRGTDPRIGELLACAEQAAGTLDAAAPMAVNLREMRRTHGRLIKLPKTLVEEEARVAPLSQQQWAISRQEADFSAFCPWLEKMVHLKRQQAECLGYEDHPYDALLEDYEPGARCRDLAPLFAALRTELTPLLQAIRQTKKRSKTAILRRNYPVEQQRAFAQEVAAAIGFDFERGRLDLAVHPFSCHLGPGDCRIAIRYSMNYFPDAFFSLLHEVGHGLYEQGLDPAHYGTPMGAAASLGLHESQARLWENLVGRGLPFWKYWYGRAKQTFPEALSRVTLTDFFTAVNHVEPSLNRVHADEVTYNLHILIRFELEKALIHGDLRAAEVPAAWNDAYRRYLGVTVPNDAEGCLQDGHWSEGLFGYFPTYTLGNIFAAQLYAKAREDLGGLETAFAQGEFNPLLDWLRVKVHRQGSRYRAADLLRHVTGSPPDHHPLVERLRQKYGEIYHVG